MTDVKETAERISTERLTFADLRASNEARQAHWGGTDNWTLADWSNAVAGEVGEACNIVKKIRRPELGTTGNSEDVSAYYSRLESEIGDVLIYLDLLAKKAGTTLDVCASRAFNEKSAALNMPVTLPLASRHADAQEGGEVELRAAAQNVYDKLASETASVTIFDQERLGDALRASIPGGVGVLSVADAITQLSAAVEAEKRRNAARDQMLATVIVNLEKSEMTAEFAVLLRDYVRAERAKLSALGLSPAEGQHNAAWLQGYEKGQVAAPSNPVVSDE